MKSHLIFFSLSLLLIWICFWVLFSETIIIQSITIQPVISDREIIKQQILNSHKSMTCFVDDELCMKEMEGYSNGWQDAWNAVK